MADKSFRHGDINVLLTAAPIVPLYEEAIRYLLITYPQDQVKDLTFEFANRGDYLVTGIPCVGGTCGCGTDYMLQRKFCRIKVAVGKREEKKSTGELLRILFHEYCHLLQYAEGRLRALPYRQREDEANAFPLLALPGFLQTLLPDKISSGGVDKALSV